MKQKFMTGWNFRRVFFLVAGGAILVESVVRKDWIGMLMGGYFAAMGLFALGCAGGYCYMPNDNDETNSTNKKIGIIDFEEIK